MANLPPTSQCVCVCTTPFLFRKRAIFPLLLKYTYYSPTAVLDTAGQDEYSAMREQYLRQGDCFLLVYSVTDPSSFDHISYFRNRILEVKGSEGLPMILVANKVDLSQRRRVSEEQGLRLAHDLGGMPYIETSAKDPPQNIDESFREVCCS